ncbi:CPXCG motif-containing cysteine-rich protein [Arhodomonas sp. SL1]|uniref:CPXCG motif-containing cysteine-rich protein n=1 Tax=Arhodomonas sp. SL1 TaxID=3425691 RepID=UPI003F8844F2
MIEEEILECPYCGEAFTTLVDWSAGAQRYVEDCPVCCRPIEIALHITADGNPERVSAARDDD